MQVELQVAAKDANVPVGVEWNRWVNATLDTAGVEPDSSAAMTVRLVDCDESLKLNTAYRGKSGATNILAFPGPEYVNIQPDTEFGDLVICLPLVYGEAREQGKDPLAHIAHLVVHGTLHLLGFDHHEAADAKRMETLEIEIMNRLGFSDPYEVG